MLSDTCLVREAFGMVAKHPRVVEAAWWDGRPGVVCGQKQSLSVVCPPYAHIHSAKM